jgi:hypothetical protein
LIPISVWSHVKRYIELPKNDDFPKRIRLLDFGEVDELNRVEGGPAPDGRVLVGEYHAKSLGAVGRVTLTDGGARLRFDSFFGSNEYGMAHICEHSWRISSPDSIFLDALLIFDESYSAFRIFSYNARGVLFSRAG